MGGGEELECSGEKLPPTSRLTPAVHTPLLLSHITCSHTSLTVASHIYTPHAHLHTPATLPSPPFTTRSLPTEEQWGGVSFCVWRLPTREPRRLSSSQRQPTFLSPSDWRTSPRYGYTWLWYQDTSVLACSTVVGMGWRIKWVN